MPKTAKPVSEETIAAEIATLKVYKPRIRQRTFFGDDNHAAIDAQISVLADGLNEDMIYRRFEETQHTLDAALQCAHWRDGEFMERPSDGWKSLL